MPRWLQADPDEAGATHRKVGEPVLLLRGVDEAAVTKQKSLPVVDSSEAPARETDGRRKNESITGVRGNYNRGAREL
jgi:hypothetical protein